MKKLPQQIIYEQKAWIASGKIGCVFASALVKKADKIGWEFGTFDTNIDGNLQSILNMNQNGYGKPIFILSMIFPLANAKSVKHWALSNGFYIETVYGTKIYDDGHNDVFEGLRIKMKEGTSWVQYFGPDSHVKTRQAPYPMLTFTVKLPAHVYAKTMIKGILHLAHASIEFLTAKKCDTLWEQSYAKTKKELGQSPDESQAAKVTFLQS